MNARAAGARRAVLRATVALRTRHQIGKSGQAIVTDTPSVRDAVRTAADIGGRWATGLSALSALRSALAIGRKPAWMLAFRTSALSALHFAGIDVH